ncbi:MAG TPA: class I SAM-dependent methyltransferase [Candidatus Nanopelagicales bacterium]|jgi:SAM-dependent methyltransferase
MNESPEPTEPRVSERTVDHETRRLSFGAEAGAYARFRPTYPREAIQWVLTAETVEVTRVLDVGAGTGALTTVLVAEGLDVTAVEPDAGMRDQLAGALPGVSVLAGSAESVPLPDSSVDAVVAGQAWHWFEPGAAVAEFARVLVPGGILGLLWNLRDDSVPWVAALSGLIGGEDTLRAARESDNVAAALRTPASLESAGTVVSTRFTEPERAVFAHQVSLTVDSLVGLVSTFSYVRLSPRRDEVLAAVRDLATTHPDLAGRNTFELPYVTAAYRSLLR